MTIRVGAIAASMAPWEDLRRVIALVSHTFTVPLGEAMDMELGELVAWAGEAVELFRRLYRPPRGR